MSEDKKNSNKKGLAACHSDIQETLQTSKYFATPQHTTSAKTL